MTALTQAALRALTAAPGEPIGDNTDGARGYALLGIGAYLINHSAAGEPPELVISIATEEEKAGRVIGDERDNAPDSVVLPESMVVRLGFHSVVGLDALEAQLRQVRTVHFPVAPKSAPSDSAAMAALRELVNKQALDHALWFKDDTDYVRQALRQLHAAIEGDLAMSVLLASPIAPPTEQKDWRLRLTHSEIDDVRRRLVGNKTLSLHHSTLNALLDDADAAHHMLSMRTNWRRDELHRLDPSTDNFAWTEYHRIFCHDYIRSQVRLAMNNERAAQAAPPEIYCYLCEARHAGDACPLTLVEKLQRFPQFYSPDAGRWYMSTDKEPICTEAAARIRELEAALRPFSDKHEAKADAIGDSDLDNEQPRSVDVTLGDFRRARRALHLRPVGQKETK